MTNRICQTLCNANGEIQFDQLILLLSIFNTPLPNMIDKKIEFLFKVYDIDKDGKIGEQDMVSIFTLLTVGSTNEDEIRFIAKSFMCEYDTDKDGKLTEEDFKKVFSHCNTNAQISK